MSSTRPAARTTHQASAFLAGTDIDPPGVEWTSQWHPEPGADSSQDPSLSRVHAAAGRKP